MLNYEKYACPICLDPNVPSSPAVSADQAAELVPFDKLKNHWYGFFKDNTFFTYHRCTQCSVLYSPSYFSVQQIETLYKNMPDNTAGIPIEILKKTQQGYFETIKKYSPLTGGYLEVGPDIGLLTECCIQDGNFSKFWLFEPNQEVHPILKQKLRGKDSFISSDLFNFDMIPDHSLSVVTMVHVLDHLIGPRTYLNKLRSKLKPGAIVAVVTHDESSFLARLIKKKSPIFCLQHPELYKPESIGALLNKANLEVLSITKTYNHFPVMYLLKHGLSVLGFKNARLPKWNSLNFPIKLGNILTVAQPKQ